MCVCVCVCGGVFCKPHYNFHHGWVTSSDSVTIRLPGSRVIDQAYHVIELTLKFDNWSFFRLCIIIIIMSCRQHGYP